MKQAIIVPPHRVDIFLEPRAEEMFRKAALAKLSSTEQLDSLMQVTTPQSWIVLTAALALIGAGLVWGLAGRTAERISGAGILMKAGGIFAIESRGTGIIKDVFVNVGDEVKEGQVVLRVTQRETSAEIRQTEALLADLRANRARSMELIQRNRDAELKSQTEERQRLAKSADALRNQIQFLEGRLRAQTEAADHGLITRDQVQATAQELEATRSSLVANQAQTTQLDAREASTRNQTDQSVFSLDQEIRRSERQLEMTKLRYTEGTEVASPYSGKVVSRLVDPGQEIRSGMAALYLELTQQPLQAVAFIPLQGARIRPGMVVQMSPEGITWEEYGYMLGVVEAVNQGPANPETMNRILRNQTLIQQFTAAGSVYEVKVRPLADPTTPSGFKWTSRQGPPIRIDSGTLLRVQIRVQEKRPIELVIPTMRQWLGI
jgi:HlyD family secretion protein